MAGNRVRMGVLLALSMIVSLMLVMTHAPPALSQVTSTVRVSNLGQPRVDRHTSITPQAKYGQSFCSGSVAVTLDKVRLRVLSYEAEGNTMGYTNRPAPIVTLRSDNSGRPGAVLQTLTNPVIEVAAADKDFTSSGYELAANTVYWVMLRRPESSGHFAFVDTASDAEDSGAVPGWSIGDAYLRNTGAGWVQPSQRYSMQMAIYASSDSPSVSFPAFPDSDCDGAVGTYELSVNENAAADTVVGRAGAFDADGDSLTHSVGGTDAAKFNSVFDLDASTGEVTVKPGASIDYESDRSYSITVSVTDGEDATGAAELEATTDAAVSVRIGVVDVDEPGVITLAPSATPRVDSELTVSLSDPDDEVMVSRVQWAKADTATGEFTDIPLNPNLMADPSYTPTAADQGKFLKVTVSYVEDTCPTVSSFDNRCRRQAEMTLDTAVAAAEGGTANQQSANSPATGAPGITGTFSVGGTLTATTTGISDSDGLSGATFTYQWLADDADISGATGSTHTLTATDAGKAFTVRVTFTDDAGHQESLTSAAVLTAQTQTVQDQQDTTPLTATVRVSNLGQPRESGHTGIGPFQSYRQSFCSSSVAVTLDKVRLRVLSIEAEGNTMGYTNRPAPIVTLRSDNSGRPGALLQTLTNPVFDNVAAADKDFTSSGYELAANTLYWVVLHQPEGSGHFAFVETASDAEDSGAVPGWSIGDAYLRDTGSGWVQPSRRYSMQMAIYASSDSPSVSFPAFPDSDCDGAVGTYELSVNENAAADTVVGRVAAHDADGDSLTHSVGGTDAAKFNSVFNLDASTGEITVKPGASIDYESDRSYSITVSVTDGEDATGAAESPATIDAAVSVRIGVVDVDEPGVITLHPSATPRVNSELTVSLSDPDDEVMVSRVQWAKADTATGEFTDIPLNPKFMADPSYTPTAADQGKFLKVTVSYVEDTCPTVSSFDNRCRRQAEMTLDTAVAAAEGGTANQQSANSPATGAPGITGTASVGGTLTATTTGISDSNGLTSATFTYQWLADDADISGATGSTHTVTATDAGKAFTVRVTFTDDAGHQESLTSSAVLTAQTQVEEDTTPLTATTHNVPESHDGSTAFIFELRFSEAPVSDFSYTTLQQHALTVTGGEVVKARRIEPGKNVRWEITVKPNSQADVTIVLPVTTDCTAQGAICTGDSRPLSARVELTIAPPPLTASIHNAPQSHDGSNAFIFELRFSEAPVTGASGFSYTTLQQHALTVTGGTLPNVRRLQPGKNLRWEITVQPSSNADVSIVLPITTDCATQGAICTADGRPLSDQVEVTVPGPDG